MQSIFEAVPDFLIVIDWNYNILNNIINPDIRFENKSRDVRFLSSKYVVFSQFL